MPLLATDPYYFNTSRYLDKPAHVRRDVDCIMSFLGKNESQIFDASKQYISREEHLFLFISALKFWQHSIEVQLTSNSTNLSTLVTIFCAESILGNQINSNSARLRNFLLNYLSREEKIELLSSYAFGSAHEFGQGGPRKKHLCHRAVIRDKIGRYHNQTYCSMSLCGCEEWLRNAPVAKINRYLNMLGTYLYNMRNSVVHDAGFVQFTSMPFHDDDLGEVIPLTADSFSNHSTKKYTSYETEISVNRFHEIMKNAAWRCFESGSRARIYKKVKLLERL